MIVHGHQVYQTYLAFKQHFSNPKFDFFQYDGKVKVKEETYQQSRGFWFCETLAKKHSDQEIKEYMLATFVSAPDPTKVWLDAFKRDGRNNWLVWQKQQAGLSYTFQQDCARLADLVQTGRYTFNEIFKAVDQHPPALKLYIKQQISLETLIILDMVLGFMKHWDEQLIDPLWEQLSFKINKYKPFLSINTMKYKGIVKKVHLSSIM